MESRQSWIQNAAVIAAVPALLLFLATAIPAGIAAGTKPETIVLFQKDFDLADSKVLAVRLAVSLAMLPIVEIFENQSLSALFFLLLTPIALGLIFRFIYRSVLNGAFISAVVAVCLLAFLWGYIFIGTYKFTSLGYQKMQDCVNFSKCEGIQISTIQIEVSKDKLAEIYGIIVGLENNFIIILTSTGYNVFNMSSVKRIALNTHPSVCAIGTATFK